MNACETAANLLPDAWQGTLAAPERAGDRLWLAQHLQECADCAGLDAFWRQMGALPAAAPDPRARIRFDQMLAAYEQGADAVGPRRSGWRAWLAPPLPAMAPLAAGLLLAIGLGAGLLGGWFLRGNAPASGAAAYTQQIADLREQVQTTRQLAVLSLLQQQSASDRLQGVTYTTGLHTPDPKITDALLRSLKYDSSPDVRLAALDALQHAVQEPAQAPVVGADIRKGLVEAFSYQKSPLVQIALVDSFVETRDQQARALLEKIRNDPQYLPEVRQRAAWGLAQPAWN